MRVVFVEAPEELIQERRRCDIDKYDEMWEGELHMSPLPSWSHQRIEVKLAAFFLTHWEALGHGTVTPHVGVKPSGTPDVDVAGVKVPRNYRGPDIVFFVAGHEPQVQRGWVVGPPDALIEIRSPGDETYEKFDFYHSLGVTEVIVVQRDTKTVEVHVRGTNGYQAGAAPDADGWVVSRVLGTAFRTERDPHGEPVLRLRRVAHPEREATV